MIRRRLNEDINKIPVIGPNNQISLWNLADNSKISVSKKYRPTCASKAPSRPDNNPKRANSKAVAFWRSLELAPKVLKIADWCIHCCFFWWLRTIFFKAICSFPLHECVLANLDNSSSSPRVETPPNTGSSNLLVKYAISLDLGDRSSRIFWIFLPSFSWTFPFVFS